MANYKTWDATNTLEVKCIGNIRCPGTTTSATYTTGNECKFNHRLCVTCRDVGGVVKIKVQSNGLPNHCFTSTVNNAIEMFNEWEVNWQPNVKGKTNYSDT